MRSERRERKRRRKIGEKERGKKRRRKIGGWKERKGQKVGEIEIEEDKEKENEQ